MQFQPFDENMQSDLGINFSKLEAPIKLAIMVDIAATSAIYIALKPIYNSRIQPIMTSDNIISL